MKRENTHPITLRQKAEEQLNEKSSTIGSLLSESDGLKLIHELQVHQIELEMQNAELVYQNDEKQNRADELAVANDRLVRIKNTLHETNENLENLLNFANAPIIVFSRHLLIRRFNHAAELMTGHEEANVLGNSIEMLFPSSPDSVYLAMIRKNLSGERLEMVEMEILHRDKSIRTVLWNSAAIFEKNANTPISIIAQVQDITERKQAEGLLKQSEERYRTLAEWSPHSVIVHNGIKIVYANPAAVIMFGATSAQDLEGTNIMDRVHPDSKEIVQLRIRSGLEEGLNAPKMELKYLKFDGTTIYTEVQGTLINYNGVPCVHGAMYDITESKKMADELRIGNARFSSMISNISDVIGIMGADGIMTYKSPNIEKWFGWLPEERIGTSGFSTVHPDDLERVGKVFSSLLEKHGSVMTLEFRYLYKDGSYKPIELTAANLLNDPEISGVLLNYRDITERKRLEEEKRVTDSKILTLSMAIEQSPVTTVITDVAGNIEFVNPKFTQTTGYTAEEVIGKNPRIFKAGNNPDAEYRELWDTILSGQIWHGVFQNKKKNGELYYESAAISPVWDNEGNIAHFLAIKEDITEWKKSEAALLKAKAEAEAANKTKGTFLANMSHEIRTPLNAIIGFSQLMKRDKSLTGVQLEYSDSINRSGEHLLQLINDILELSKIEAGRTKLKLENFDIQALLNDMQMLFKEPVQSKQLQLIFETANDLPRYIIADGQKLRQILINLIGNAVKFTSEGGISVRCRFNDIKDHTKFLLVEIKDSGMGIAEKELGKLFRQFEQTSSGIKSSSGTGLGLALSRELALFMGGDITVVSEEGKGSVFTVKVEIMVGEAEVRDAAINRRVTGIVNPHGAYRVLVVDDNKENRQVMGSFLSLAGFETKEAVDGEDAIVMFEQWDPHLILMDMRMPLMDGYEATRRIRSMEKGKQTPVIAVTASTFEDEKKRTFELEIQGYIRKPFRENELFETIGNVLGIKYIFEEETSADAMSGYLSNEGMVEKDIAKLPEELVMQMRDAAEGADFVLLKELIGRIDGNYSSLAGYLVTKADDFDYIYFKKALSRTQKDEKSE